MIKLLLVSIINRVLVASATDPKERDSILREVELLGDALDEVAKIKNTKLFKTIVDYIKHNGNLPGTPASRAAAEQAAKDGGE